MEKEYCYKGNFYKIVCYEEEDVSIRYARSLSGDWLYIESIVVAEGKRNQGIGTAAMKKLLSDHEGADVYLLASGELGGDEMRIKRWYGRFGFVETKDKRDLPFNYNMKRKK